MKIALRVLLLSLFFVSLEACSTFSRGDACDSSDTTLGSSDFKVEVSAYTPAKSLARSVIILPPTGGTNYIDRYYARRLCKSGYDVKIVNRWTSDTGTSTDLEIHQGFYSRMLKAFELTLASIETPFVGVLGTSLGGLYASVAAAKIERIDSVFLIVAGAPIADVIVKSDQEEMRRLAKVRRERFGIGDDADYVSRLKKVFLLEPMSQPPLKKPKDFAMVVAEEDTTVPTEYQHQLRDFLKPRKLISLSNGHFWAIINTWLHHDDEIVEFFNEGAKP
jgi:hypothetical protein